MIIVSKSGQDENAFLYFTIRRMCVKIIKVCINEILDIRTERTGR